MPSRLVLASALLAASERPFGRGLLAIATMSDMFGSFAVDELDLIPDDAMGRLLEAAMDADARGSTRGDRTPRCDDHAQRLRLLQSLAASAVFRSAAVATSAPQPRRRCAQVQFDLGSTRPCVGSGTSSL
jgi:hypothetical protein